MNLGNELGVKFSLSVGGSLGQYQAANGGVPGRVTPRVPGTGVRGLPMSSQAQRGFRRLDAWEGVHKTPSHHSHTPRLPLPPAHHTDTHV